jgi:transaldolase
MKIFLDTANVTQLREGVAMGLVDGCTTNPSLIAKEKRPVRPLIEEILEQVRRQDLGRSQVSATENGHERATSESERT